MEKAYSREDSEHSTSTHSDSEVIDKDEQGTLRLVEVFLTAFLTVKRRLQADKSKNMKVFNKSWFEKIHVTMLVTFNLQVAAMRSNILESCYCLFGL